MRARTLVHAVMAVGPAIYLGIIAFSAHATTGYWRSPEYGPKVHRVLLGYAKLLREDQNHLTMVPRSPYAQFESVAREWTKAWENHAIGEIPPAAYIDSGQEGVRLEVEQRRAVILLGLSRYTHDFFKARRYDEAIDTFALTTKMMGINRYDSPVASLHSAECFRILAAGLLAEKKSMTLSQRSRAIKIVKEFGSDPERPLLAFEKQAAMKKTAAWADVPGQTQGRTVNLGRTASTVNPRIENLAKAYGATAIPVDFARMAWSTEVSVGDVIRETVRQLSTVR